MTMYDILASFANEPLYAVPKKCLTRLGERGGKLQVK